MKNRFFLLSAILLIFLSTPTSVMAVIKTSGDLEVIVNEPLFPDQIIWFPSQSATNAFQIKNHAQGVKTLEIETTNESQSQSLAGGLEIVIKSSGKEVFGGSPVKTIQNFWDIGRISLGDIPADDTGKVFDVEVVMPESIGNQYQGGRAAFDLRLSFRGDDSSAVTVTGSQLVLAVAATPTPGVPASGAAGEAVAITPAEPPTATPANNNVELQVTGESGGQVAGTAIADTLSDKWLILLILLVGIAVLLLWLKRRKH